MKTGLRIGSIITNTSKYGVTEYIVKHARQLVVKGAPVVENGIPKYILTLIPINAKSGKFGQTEIPANFLRNPSSGWSLKNPEMQQQVCNNMKSMETVEA